MTQDALHTQLKLASGCVEDDRRLVSFLYELMRDHVTPGVIDRLIIASSDGVTQYTNGFLAQYAQHVADILTPKKEPCA